MTRKKSITLIGNREKSLNFMKEVSGTVDLRRGQCVVAGVDTHISYDENISRVVKKESGGVIIVTGDDNQIPQNVANSHSFASLPLDSTFHYATNNELSPFEFLQRVVNNPNVKEDQPAFTQRFCSFFGGNVAGTAKRRHMSVQLGAPSKKPKFTV